MQKKSKLVHGVGRNDADYPVNVTVLINGVRKSLWNCQYYQAWVGMLKRCYSAKSLLRSPSYIGCTVATEWHSFSTFRCWMEGQDHEGNHLDKDILKQDNKVYGPEFCVFVPISLNVFMTDGGAVRGNIPIGAVWDKSRGKFLARCRNPFTRKQEHLGSFTDPSEAHEAWRARKHEISCIYADMQTDSRIAAALRSRYSNGVAK